MTLTSTLISALANLLIGVAVIPFYIRLANAKNIVDIPNHRSSHTTLTPRGGGLFLVLGSILLAGLYALSHKETNENWPFLAAALCVAVLGLIDDLKPLSSVLRLGIQVALAAGLFAVLSDNLHFEIFNIQLLPPENATNDNSSISLFTIQDSLFPYLAAGIFVVWIVGCLNIYNFMDGIDGIATLQGIVAATAWAAIAYNTNNEFALLLALLLIGGLLAFLLYNWSPAKVFMGDCASSFLGFIFAAMPLLHSQHSGSDLWSGMNLSALMLFPFLFDGTFTLIRRMLRRENVLEAHRSHLFQRWNQRGASHRLVSSIYGLWATIGGATALLVHFEQIALLPAYGIVLVPAGFIVYGDFKNLKPSRDKAPLGEVR